MDTLKKIGLKTENSSFCYHGVSVISLAIWLYFYFLRGFSDLQGTDFFPIYSASATTIQGHNPYSSEFSDWLKNHWQVSRYTQVAAVSAYPLPFLLIVSPITFFDLSTAVPIWTVILFFSAISITQIADNRTTAFLSILFFYPLFHALVIKTSSVLWLGIAACALNNYWQNKNPIILGLLLTALPLKPQAGLIFFLYILVKLVIDKKFLPVYSMLGASFILWTSAFCLDPDWLPKWLANLDIYKKDAEVVSLLPEGLILLLLSARISPLTFAATLQMVAFPVNDIYSVLPLLVPMIKFTSRYLLVTSISSLLAALIFATPNSYTYLWIGIILPFSFFAVLNQNNLRAESLKIPRNHKAAQYRR